MRPWTLLLFFPVVGCVCGPTEDRTWSPDADTTLRYVVAWPAGDGPAPVWIYQPGDGTLRDAFDAHGAAVLASSVAQRFGVVFVFPELRRQQLSDDAERYCALDFFHRLDDLTTLLDEVATLPRVDSTQRYLVAHSAGAEIVTLTAARRPEVRAIATYGGGTASLGELDQLPSNFERLRANDCSEPARRWLRRGVFWDQLLSTRSSFTRFSRSTGPTSRSSASATTPCRGSTTSPGVASSKRSSRPSASSHCPAGRTA